MEPAGSYFLVQTNGGLSRLDVEFSAQGVSKLPVLAQGLPALPRES